VQVYEYLADGGPKLDAAECGELAGVLAVVRAQSQKVTEKSLREG
jgi:hypothetical protein